MFGTRPNYPKGPVTDPSFEDAALLVCNHGSSIPGKPLTERTRATAEACGFAEVAGCSLYGEPNLEEVLVELVSRPIFLVPTFLSAGITLEALCARLCALPTDMEIILCPPLGAHPDLSGRVLEAARGAAICRGWAPAGTALLLIGHGSQISGASGDLARQTRELARTRALFGEVETAYLSQEPDIDSALANVQCPQIVAVGCFAASGRHASRDVPEILSQTDRPIAYSGAIGEAPWCDQLLLEQALRGADCQIRRRFESMLLSQVV